MRVHALFGLLAGAGLVAAAPADATADLRTNASGRWMYVSALSADYGRFAGSPALVLQSGNALATLAGAPLLFSNGKDEDDDEDGSWLGNTLSSGYVVVLAGLGGAAVLASDLGDDSGTSTPLSNNPTTPGGDTPGGDNPSDTPIDQSPTSPETTTPEPVTMTLLATGLAGLGGAQLRRRRQQPDA